MLQNAGCDSSSPGATLAGKAERKAPKDRSRANPTFDQRQWFGADAYRAKLATPNTP